MKRITTLVSFLLTLVVPYILLMIGIRALFTPAFLQFEYNRPGFPPDVYGFTTADRLKYGGISLDYLFNSSDPQFLANVKLSDGTPLYNERELSHMLDVKILLQKTLTLSWIFLGLAGLALFWAWRGRWLVKYCRALARGGWLTIGLIAAVLLGVGISFDWLFTQFHHLFFTGDSWLFQWSDSLIRLFPLPLWQDGFIGVGILAVILSILLIWLGHWATRHI